MGDYLGNLVGRSLHYTRNLPAVDSLLRPRLASRFEPPAATHGPLPETRPLADEGIDVTETAGDDRSASDGQASSITGRRLLLADREPSIGEHAPPMIDRDLSVSVQHTQPVQTATPGAIQEVRQPGSVPATIHAQPDRLMSPAHSIKSTPLPGVPDAALSASQPDINQPDPPHAQISATVSGTQSGSKSQNDPAVPVIARTVPPPNVARPTERSTVESAIEPNALEHASDDMRPNLSSQDDRVVPVIVRTVPPPNIARPTERSTVESAIGPNALEHASDDIRPNLPSQGDRVVPAIVRTVPPPNMAQPAGQPDTELEPGTLEPVSDNIRPYLPSQDDRAVPVIARTVPTPNVARPAGRPAAEPAIEPYTLERVSDDIRPNLQSQDDRAVPVMVRTGPTPNVARPARRPAAEPAIEPNTLERASNNVRPDFQSQDARVVPAILRTVPTLVVARPAERSTLELAIERGPDPVRAATQSDDVRAVSHADDKPASPPAAHTRRTTIVVQPATHSAPSSSERIPNPAGSLTARGDRAVFGSSAIPVAARPLRNMVAEPKRQPDQPAPTINVTIGRIEVRAEPAPAAPASKPRSTPAMNLDEYLRRRATGDNR
jgi:hypothetical protein